MKKLSFLLILSVISCYKNESRRIELEFKTIENKVVNISDFDGKVIIIDFWASWCAPCIKEIPAFIELQDKYKDKVQFIGFNVNENEEEVKEFIKTMGINYIIAYSNEEIERKFGGIVGLPTTFIIGKDRTIKAKAVGYKPKEWFEAQIINALNESH